MSDWHEEQEEEADEDAKADEEQQEQEEEADEDAKADEEQQEQEDQKADEDAKAEIPFLIFEKNKGRCFIEKS